MGFAGSNKCCDAAQFIRGGVVSCCVLAGKIVCDSRCIVT